MLVSELDFVRVFICIDKEVIWIVLIKIMLGGFFWIGFKSIVW